MLHSQLGPAPARMTAMAPTPTPHHDPALEAAPAPARSEAQRHTSWTALTLRLTFGSLWGAVLIVGALATPRWAAWTARLAPEYLPLVMLAGLGGGTYVFCVVVLDRLFPCARPWLRGAVELAAALTTLLSLSLIALL
ncbi:MAG: hypothetical protein D6824_03120, partial [Planctomycetota bacterium]